MVISDVADHVEIHSKCDRDVYSGGGCLQVMRCVYSAAIYDPYHVPAFGGILIYVELVEQQTLLIVNHETWKYGSLIHDSDGGSCSVGSCIHQVYVSAIKHWLCLMHIKWHVAMVVADGMFLLAWLFVSWYHIRMLVRAIALFVVHGAQHTIMLHALNRVTMKQAGHDSHV